MKKLRHLFLSICVSIALSGSLRADELLPDSVAIEIVDAYRQVIGLPPSGLSTSTAMPCDGVYCTPHCGTSALYNFLDNRDHIDPRILQGLSAADPLRPDLPLAYNSPSGLFTIHYSKTGTEAVYHPNDDSDGDGVPNFVEQVAIIADSVYQFEVITLGYPKPPVDTGIVEGGDEKFDIYLKDQPITTLGLTYADAESYGTPGDFVATSYCVLDNDYNEFASYTARPLDAVRVTFAHEYFHGIQFGMDIGEFDVVNNIQRRYWMEMTAVWMEEQAYDNINDYYNYIRFFLSSPRRSLQQFSISDLHPYGAVLFPLYLSERFDRDIIRRIWQRCALGGPNSLSAINEEIVATSGASLLTFADAMAEFGVWNYFLGPFANAAPNGSGYEEKEFYPAIPESSLFHESNYPFFRDFADSSRQAQFNGISYIEFDGIQDRSTSIYRCDSSESGNCVDSTEVMTLGAVFGTGNPSTRWGLAVIYQLESVLDSHTVEIFSIPDGAGAAIDFENPDRYRSITLVVSPATISPGRYGQFPPPNFLAPFGFGISADSGKLALPPPNRAASSLYPYPNPAVFSEMNGSDLRFRFVAPTNADSSLTYQTAFLSIDLYTASGDYVQTIIGDFSEEDRFGFTLNGNYSADWNMTNQSGKPVAGGVYLAVAKLYVDQTRSQLLAEAKQKLLIVR